MAKDTSAIISGMGVGISILDSLVKKTKKRNLTDEDLRKLATPEGDELLEKFADLIAESCRPKQPSFKLAVNYDLSLEEAIKAENYDWKNSDITSENFPQTRKGTVDIEIVLVHFDHYIQSEEVLKELDKQGFRAAELPELLVFGEKYPDEQRKYPIIALGSVWRRWSGRRYVACLRRSSGRRDLDLRWFGSGWSSSDRFASVRK